MKVAPLIPVAIEMLIGLIRVAKEANELSNESFAKLKSKLDEEFSTIPGWEDL
jgi:hypothetical protein